MTVGIVLFVHVDHGTVCVIYVDLAVHSNVFFGGTVGTVCCLSMCSMAHPVSHNYVDLAVHCTIVGLGGVSVLSTCLCGLWYSLYFLSQVLCGFHGSLCINMLFFGTVSVPLVWILWYLCSGYCKWVPEGCLSKIYCWFATTIKTEALTVLFVSLWFNPFTAPACKISRLKDAWWCLKSNIFSGPVTHLLSLLCVSTKNPFTCQCQKENTFLDF